LHDSRPPREIGGNQLACLLRQVEQDRPGFGDEMEPSSSITGTSCKQLI